MFAFMLARARARIAQARSSTSDAEEREARQAPRRANMMPAQKDNGHEADDSTTARGSNGLLG